MLAMTRLSANVNKVALLRNTREGNIPDVLKFARLALDAGAHGITVHPRPDRRHIRPGDVETLAQLLTEPAYREMEFNIEGNPFTGEYLDHARRVRPDQCTLVPDDPNQATSDHGWDVTANESRLGDVIGQLHDLGCRVSLFMDPILQQIDSVPETGADRIELFTESFADAHLEGGAALERSYNRFKQAAEHARKLGLGVNAGHDLNLHNLGQFVTIPGIREISIGHALIADALELGMSEAVRAYLAILEQHAPRAEAQVQG